MPLPNVRTFVLALLAASFATGASSSAGYADGEAVSAVAGQPPRPHVFSTLKITLAFQASQHGNAEVVFGRANTAGELRLSGIRAVVGFDRGAWTVTGDRFRQTLTRAANTAVLSPHQMTAVIWLDSEGTPVRVSAFRIDGAPFALSPKEAATVMDFLDPREWDTFKTVTRGDASAAETDVRFIPVGTSFILR